MNKLVNDARRSIVLLGVMVIATSPFVSPESVASVKNTGETRIVVPRCEDRVRIDGRIDDPIWRDAARIDRFVEVHPRDNVTPDTNTEVLLAHDQDHLYLAFRCFDADPERIRATITDRDNIYEDDFAGVIIDTFGDDLNGFEFFVNPYGIQADLSRQGDDEDDSYDTVWQSAGHVDESGWTAEIAIPFRSIRFPDVDVQKWGLHVVRVRPRDSREEYSWAPVSRDDPCYMCQSGEMVGMEGISRGRNLELLPYAISSQTGSLESTGPNINRWGNQDPDGEAGVGLKYGITSNFTLDATYNPDFSQIESDATQIDANRTFALFFPERRPFFLEGKSVFDSDIGVVYTRMINDPVAAGKLTGKSGNTTVGVLSAVDENTPYIVPSAEGSEAAAGKRSVSNIVRFKRDVGSNSFLGLLVTDRRADGNGGANTTYGADWRVRFKEHYLLEGQVMGSRTREPDDTTMSKHFRDFTFGSDKRYTSFFDGEQFDGFAVSNSFSRNGRNLNIWANARRLSSTFRAENGFVNQNDIVDWTYWNGYTIWFDNNRFIEKMHPQCSIGRTHTDAGQVNQRWHDVSASFQLKRQTYFWTGVVWGGHGFEGQFYGGIGRWRGAINTAAWAKVNAGLGWDYGPQLIRDHDNPRKGDIIALRPWILLRPTSQLSWRVNYNFQRMNEENGENLYRVFVLRNHVTYQFTRRLYLRLITEYVDDSQSITVDPLLSYKLNPFTVFFAGSSHSLTENIVPGDPGFRQTDRVFFVKFQYLVRV